MQRLEGIGAIPKLATHLPAADTAAIVTIAAVAENRHAIDWISWSYDKDNAAAETLTLAIAGVTVATWYIPIAAATTQTGPPRHIPFPQPIIAGVNQAVVVTLSASSGTSKGTVTVGYR